jgi:hypothetical protein
MRRPTIAIFVSIAVLATVTVTAFAVASPDVSAPSARDLPSIVSQHPVAFGTTTWDAASDSVASTATPFAGAAGTPSTDAARVSAPPGGDAQPAGGSSPGQRPAAPGAAEPGSPAGSGTAGGSGGSDGSSPPDASHTSDGHGSGDGGHSPGGHEVVRPHLHESNGNEHGGGSD